MCHTVLATVLTIKLLQQRQQSLKAIVLKAPYVTKRMIALM